MEQERGRARNLIKLRSYLRSRRSKQGTGGEPERYRGMKGKKREEKSNSQKKRGGGGL